MERILAHCGCEQIERSPYFICLIVALVGECGPAHQMLRQLIARFAFCREATVHIDCTKAPLSITRHHHVAVIVDNSVAKKHTEDALAVPPQTIRVLRRQGSCPAPGSIQRAYRSAIEKSRSPIPIFAYSAVRPRASTTESQRTNGAARPKVLLSRYVVLLALTPVRPRLNHSSRRADRRRFLACSWNGVMNVTHCRQTRSLKT